MYTRRDERFSDFAEVRPLLVSAGWVPGRCVEISPYWNTIGLKAQHAISFLKEFDMLSVGTVDHGPAFARTRMKIDSTIEPEYHSDVEVVEKYLNQKVFIVANEEADTGYVMISETGEVHLLTYEVTLHFIARNPYVGLERLLLGLEPEDREVIELRAYS